MKTETIIAKIIKEVSAKTCMEEIDMKVIADILQDSLKEYYSKAYDEGYEAGNDDGYENGVADCNAKYR